MKQVYGQDQHFCVNCSMRVIYCCCMYCDFDAAEHRMGHLAQITRLTRPGKKHTTHAYLSFTIVDWPSSGDGREEHICGIVDNASAKAIRQQQWNNKSLTQRKIRSNANGIGNVVEWAMTHGNACPNRKQTENDLSLNKKKCVCAYCCRAICCRTNDANSSLQYIIGHNGLNVSNALRGATSSHNIMWPVHDQISAFSLCRTRFG